MPELCRFLGIVIYMLYDDHRPPHFHAEYANTGYPWRLIREWWRVAFPGEP
jgi:hypothetical protein